MRDFLMITKALADENRIRALLALRFGELCVCQITELFGLAPSTISKHLSILYQAGLLNSRKDGRWVYYSLAGKEASPPVRAALRWVSDSVSESSRAAEDAKRLQKVLQIDPAELCKRS